MAAYSQDRPHHRAEVALERLRDHFQAMTDISLSSDVVLGVTVPLRHARGRAVRIDATLDAILANHGYPPVIEQLLADGQIAVEVDVEGRVTTRGATPRIHIDGRPAPMEVHGTPFERTSRDDRHHAPRRR